MVRVMHMFRKYQYMLLVVFGVLLMVVFVAGDAAMRMVGPPGGRAGGGTAEDDVVLTWKEGVLRGADLYKMASEHRVVVQYLDAIVMTALQREAFPRAPGLRFDQRTRRVQDPGIPRIDSDDAIIETMLLAAKAESMGIAIDDDGIFDFLDQLGGGELSRGELGNLFHSTIGDRMADRHMMDVLRRELMAQQVRMMAASGMFVMRPTQAWDYHKRLNRRVKAEILALPVADFKDQVEGEPKEAQVAALFESGKEVYPDPAFPEPGFKRRRKIAFEFVKADFNKFLEEEIAKVEGDITEADVDEYYERNKETRYRELDLPSEGDTGTDAAGTPDEGTPEGDKPEGEPEESTPDSPKEEESKPSDDADAPPAPPSDDAPSNEEQPKSEPEKPADEPAKESADEPAEKPADAPASENAPESEGAADSPEKNESADEPAAPEGCGQESEEEAADTPPESTDAAPAAPEGDAAEDTSSETPAAEDTPTNETPAAETPAKEAPAEETADETPKADAPAESEPEKAADDQPADSEKKAPESPNADDAAADSEKPAEGEDDESLPEAEEVKYKPLDDELRKEIREQIAKDRASSPARERLNAAFTAIRRRVDKYSMELTKWNELHKHKPELAKPTPVDLAALAEEHGLTSGKTELSDALTIQEHELGKTSMFFNDGRQFRFIGFHEIAFSEQAALFQPQTIRGEEPDIEYLFWGIEEEEPYVPTLAEARDDVVDAWKMEQALQLARKEATQLIEQAKDKESLKDLLAEEDSRTVVETNPFAWMSMGFSALGMGGAPSLSNVDGTENIGHDFMKAVFALKVGQTGTAENHPESVVYVVRIVSESPTEDELREQFVNGGFSQELNMLASGDTAELLTGWNDDLERELSVVRR